MKNLAIIAAIAAGVYLFFAKRKPGSDAAMPGQQLVLWNGSVLDTGNGVIFDALTGNYTNTINGQIIYEGVR